MPIPPGTKGIPHRGTPSRIGDIAGAGWRLHADVQLPAAVLRRSALDNNGRWMRRFAEHFDVALCPHGKTTMAPQIFDRQLRDGAWGLTCATIAHLRLYHHFGIRRVIFANQIVSSAAAEWLARTMAADAGFEVYVFVDSALGADLLAGAARAAGLLRPIPVLIEIGPDGGRTGVRGTEAALDLARHVRNQPTLALTGVATFEGIVAGRTDREMEPHVEALLTETIAAAEAMARDTLFDPLHPIILSAGGSRFFDLVAFRLKEADVGRTPLVVLRSGCYISHDALHYEVAFERLLERSGRRGIEGRLHNALEVWGEVQSWPEPGQLFVNIGKRDVSYDADLPRALAVHSIAGAATRPIARDALVVRKLSDQHAHIEVGAPPPLAIGDHVGFGMSHPCTTFDKWRLMYEVDDDDVIVDAIATFF